MGQTPSKNQGTLTFGYIATANAKPSAPLLATPVTIDIDPATNEQYHDLVSERPELYALRSCTKNEMMCEDNAVSRKGEHQQQRQHQQQQQQQLGRVDSGYNEHDDDERKNLKSDLDYIDETYYHRNRSTAFASTLTLAMQQHNRQSLIEEQPFTFIDACAGELNNRTMQEVDASARRLVHLSPNISYLKMIRRLDLSHNALSQLPDAIGSLENLEFLCLSHNQLAELPDSMSNIINLVELDVSYNRLHDLTPCFRAISKKLQTIHAENNFIAFISFHIRNMVRLSTFNLSDNPIRVLPAEIAQLPHLRRMVTRGCPLVTEITHGLKHDPPTLREICARIVVDTNTRPSRQPHSYRRQEQLNSALLPAHLVVYLQSAKPCSFCHGPYFEHYVTRGQWIEKPDGMMPLEHRLCSAHWRDDNDRILHMFSANQPSLPAPSPSKKERRLKRDDPTLVAGAGTGTGATAAAAAEEDLVGGGSGSIVTASTAATNGSSPTPPSPSEPGSATATTDRWRIAQRKVNTHRWLTTKLKRPPL